MNNVIGCLGAAGGLKCSQREEIRKKRLWWDLQKRAMTGTAVQDLCLPLIEIVFY